MYGSVRGAVRKDGPYHGPAATGVGTRDVCKTKFVSVGSVPFQDNDCQIVGLRPIPAEIGGSFVKCVDDFTRGSFAVSVDDCKDALESELLTVGRVCFNNAVSD